MKPGDRVVIDVDHWDTNASAWTTVTVPGRFVRFNANGTAIIKADDGRRFVAVLWRQAPKPEEGPCSAK